jgi:DNA-directed RNA polymerase alpha subunit
MTANKDLKRLIRSRMYKTGESYTAARRHFLHSEEAKMTTLATRPEQSKLRSPVDHLQLTLKTARVLKQHDIMNIGQLARMTERELADIGIGSQQRIEVREVLASRGL